ncbi:MAG: beta-N-acetylhexosaminidase [Sphingomonadaceae bacterium]|nr:beta-N-acetylhexosaminidase [Sphingomonadaceae bacterium]
MLPAFFGLAGASLSPDERDFFRDCDPAGFILFQRNCASRAQLRGLTDELRALSGRDDVPILIDQEGGRVARLKPPEWPPFPPGERFAALYDISPIAGLEAARVNAAAIAALLVEVGVNVDCLPLLDVRQPGAHDIIGDRALGSDPLAVASLGRMVVDGLREGRVVGVVKHVPGHGRAMADSHLELPVVDAPAEALEIDIAPFAKLHDAPMAMTAHVVYTAWDAERCASVSPKIIAEIIRGRIGFDGLLMSDDLGMKALAGDFADRARDVIAAGCDIALHCSGDMAEMQAAAGALEAIAEAARDRMARAMATIVGTEGEAYAPLAEKRDAIFREAGIPLS